MDGIPVQFAQLAEFKQFGGIRLFVDTVDGGTVPVFQGQGHGFVGGQHALLNKLVAFIVLFRDDARHAAVLVHNGSHFREVQIQGSLGVAVAAQDGGQIPGFPHRGGNFPLVVSLQHGEGLLIGQTRLAADESVRKACTEHLPLLIKFHFAYFCQAHDIRPQAAQIVGKAGREHWKDAVRQVRGIAAAQGFPIQRAAGPDEMGDVRNVNGQRPAGRSGRDGNGVVKIPGACRVNGDDGTVRPVFPAGEFPGGRVLRQRFQFPEHGGGKFRGKAIFSDNGFHVHVGLVRIAEHLHDFPARGFLFLTAGYGFHGNQLAGKHLHGGFFRQFNE